MFEYKQCCVLFGSPDVIIEVSTYIATSLMLFEPPPLPTTQKNIYNSCQKNSDQFAKKPVKILYNSL